MGIYQRQERLIAKIDIITEEEKQGKGTVNFTCVDGTKRFASFVTEEYDSETNMWAGKKSVVFDALQKAFANDEWITLFLARVNSEHDVLQYVREVIEQ
jgi:hypothetical protein